MEEIEKFLSELEDSLLKHREYLNTVELPRLKEHFILYKSVFDGLTGLLLKKGLITEDPYKYDVKISEVKAPSNHPVIDSEKTSVMSQRLSQYERQLDFLNHFFQFSADFMTLPRLKNIISFIQWIDWDNLNSSATGVNTQILGDIIEKIKQGSDPMSMSLLSDAVKKIINSSRLMMGILKKVSMYQREKYKFEIRSKILLPLNLTETAMRGKQEEEILKQIKSNFKANMGAGVPYIKSLLQEIVHEETSVNGDKLKGEILKKLQLKKKKVKKKEINFRHLLLESLKILSTGGQVLNDALKKIQENSHLLQNRKLSFGEKFRSWLMNLSGNKKNKIFFDIEYFNEKTSSTKRMRINPDSFLEQGFRETRILSALGNKMSTTFLKLENSPEEDITHFLDTHISLTREIAEKLDPLNVYFKSELPQSERAAVKGVKLELSSIKSSLRKAHKKYLEYIAQVEEYEQLRKLGIDNSTED